ncbi:MAG: CRISPR-associated helicase Cas3' [Rikenellaceae bacterium]
MANVAILAANFASEFGMSEYARLAALIHDKGKEQCEFQSYIKCVSGYDTTLHNYTKRPHAYVGALIAKHEYPAIHRLISPIVIAHHRGLYDESEYKIKMQLEIPEDVTVNSIDCKLSKPTIMVKSPSEVNHIIRMLFSCLVDADYLDTEAFMNESKAKLRQSTLTIADLLPKMEKYLAMLKKSANNTPLNEIRDRIQQRCRQSANKPCGFYSLSVPTGGGKTISSLLWAILHSMQNNKRRIIIAIPYTSIITQTAKILQEIFGYENVLEHHSSIDVSKERTGTDSLRSRLASENWDAPIVVTTNVQLFESIYSNTPSQCRKLHNICNSVIILDEVQVLPLEHLQPILDCLKHYNQLFGISVLFTTASLPAFRNKILDEAFAKSGGCHKSPLQGFENIEEIIPDSFNLHKLLQRTSLYFEHDVSSYDSIAARLASHQKVLCVVNTRRDAVEIYNRLPQCEHTFHLSRMMCSKHISRVISKIKSLLRQDCHRPIRVVSTQLIEAGVDIDFPVVYRQETGLDSILQAAGRCNREGAIEGLAPVHIFKLDKPLPRGFISYGVNSTKSLGDIKDWYAPSTMTSYFIQLYSRANTFDKSNIRELLYDPSNICFETASRDFQLIEQKSRIVVVNYENSCDLITTLKSDGSNYQLMRQLFQYSVNLRESDFKELVKNNLIEEVLPGIYFLPDKEQYNSDVGLQITSHFLEELLIK